MIERQSFNFYRSYFEAVKNLEPMDRDAVWMAICGYALDGVEPDITGVPAAMFILVRPNLDASRKKAESGSAGGASKANAKQTYSKQEAKQKQTPSYKELGVGTRNKELGIRSEEYESTYPPQKAKEPKVQWADNVTMTNAEHEKLLATHGPADTERLIAILDNYKGSTGKRYKDDYRAILSWCIDRLEQERGRRPGNGTGANQNTGIHPGESESKWKLSATDL